MGFVEVFWTSNRSPSFATVVVTPARTCSTAVVKEDDSVPMTIDPVSSFFLNPPADG